MYVLAVLVELQKVIVKISSQTTTEAFTDLNFLTTRNESLLLLNIFSVIKLRNFKAKK